MSNDDDKHKFGAAFSEGSKGIVVPWNKHDHDDRTPKVIRGLASRLGIYYCQKNKIDYYYIDTGYFGNFKKKIWHRITKNNLQYLGPIKDRPADRLEMTRLQIKPMTNGSHILLVPPSEKVMNFFNIDLAKWLTDTKKEIKKHSDRKIITRLKPPRRERITNNTMESALEQDIYCLVTFNSIAAVEALMYGKPAITLGPNAATALCTTSLKRIENLRIPSFEETHRFFRHLAYHQFLMEEIKNGYAWRILNGA